MLNRIAKFAAYAALFVILFCGPAVAARKRLIKVSSKDYFVRGKVTCLIKGKRFIPGTLKKKNTRFLSSAVVIARLRQQVKTKSGKAKVKLLKKIKRLRKQNKSDKATCKRGPVTADEILGISNENDAVFDNIFNRFKVLHKTASIKDAAAKLVSELNAGFTGVAEAKLSKNGYAVFITFLDGQEAVFDLFPWGSTKRRRQLNTATTDSSPMLMRAKTRDGLGQAPYCPSALTSENRRVLIVASASVTDPDILVEVEFLKIVLRDHGWNEDLVDTRYATGGLDYSSTPDSMMAVHEYAFVIYLGRGHRWPASDGSDHYYLQGFQPGSKEDFADEGVSPAKFKRWQSDYANGWLRAVYTFSEEYQFKIKEIWLRDDFIRWNLLTSPGSMYYFISSDSWQLASEYIGELAGSFVGWEGLITRDLGEMALEALLPNMAGQSKSLTDEEGFSKLTPSLRSGPLGGKLRVALINGDYYLPAWGTFKTVPADGVKLPKGTTSVDAKISYKKCPMRVTTERFTPGKTRELDLLPLESGIYIKAFNSNGKLLGTGEKSQTFKSGGDNEVILRTCVSAAKFSSLGYPGWTGGTDPAYETETVSAKVEYLEEGYPEPKFFDFNPGTISKELSGLWPGEVKITYTAKNKNGEAVGIDVQKEKVACDTNYFDAHFGWIKFTVDELPAGSVKARITSHSTGKSIVLANGASGEMYGLTYGTEEAFTVESFSESGSEPQQTEVIRSYVDTGRNDVSLTLCSFGLILSTSKNKIAADGRDTANITIIARKWRDTDTTVPTGDPIVGREITFNTSSGTLSKTKVATNSEGKATVQLTGTENAFAVVTASVADKFKTVDIIIGTELPGYQSRLGAVFNTKRNLYECGRGLYITFVPVPGYTKYDITFLTNGYDYVDGSTNYTSGFKLTGRTVGDKVFDAASLEAHYNGISTLVDIPAGHLYSRISGAFGEGSSPDFACTALENGGLAKYWNEDFWPKAQHWTFLVQPVR
ncbi:MAG: hypothetical protein GX589_09820 [Deltaproteobacteria bacterium]|nr:hypothetical protein [Deltaproteobacteria bacterium]